MTTKETLKALKTAGKPVSLGRLYVYIKRIGIVPSGVNQRPQQYPPDTAERIKKHLGLDSPGQLALPLNGKTARQIISLKTLRAERKKGKGTR